MPNAIIDLVGKKFSRLLVMRKAEGCGRRTKWVCQCDCGGTAVVATGDLRVQKYCSSCKPKGRPSHGFSHLPEFGVWAAMKQRCDNPNCNAYKDYGARGITYCERWVKFENFLQDMAERPTKDHTLERINNDGNYEPANCTWATRKQQARNFRKNKYLEFNGERRCVSEWAEIYGTTHDAIYKKLKRGRTVEDAITGKPSPKVGMIVVGGREMSITAAERFLGFGKGTIFRRVQSGYSIEEAISLPYGCNKYTMIEMGGETISAHELEKRMGFRAGKIRQRMRNLGYSVNEAITLPKHGKKLKGFK